MAKSMREVADELGVSKDLVKYHRKKLGEDDYAFVRGQYLILESGVAKIKSYLTKEKGNYSTQFEHRMLSKISDVDLSLLKLSQDLYALEKKLEKLDQLEEGLSRIEQGITDIFDIAIETGI